MNVISLGFPVPTTLSYRRRIPDPDVTTRRTQTFQVVVAAPLLFPQVVGKEFATVFLYYGAVALFLPAVVSRVAGTALEPYQRAVIALGIGLHGYGILLDLYWSVWWYDVITHAFSGALLAAGCYAFVLAVARVLGRPAGPWVHVAAFGLVLSGGVTWEVYEVLAPWQTIYPTGDALKDLVSNTVGWSLVAAFHSRLLGDVPDALARRVHGIRQRSRRLSAR